jgi:integrase/recombinase XerD
MKRKSNLIGSLLQNFFLEFLVNQRNLSTQTLASYRDTFRLLLQFVRDRKKIEPSAVCICDLNVELVLSFLEYLERDRHNSIRSRNQRLAAIRAFFRMVALRDPESIGQASQILAIPLKRADRRVIKALSREEVEAIISAPDLSQWNGRRDHALLLTLYNTGARVSELISLRCRQVHFGTSTYLQLHGKGRKERTVPLWPKTARVLRGWFQDIDDLGNSLIFPSVRGRPLTRNGVNYILQQAVSAVSDKQPSLRDKKISPHSMRHSTAMHLLQSGVDISMIALWLGHESTDTTHVYLEADLNMKEQTLRKLTPIGKEVPRFKATDEVLAFLATL